MSGGNPAAQAAIMGAVDGSLSMPRMGGGGGGGGIASIMNALRDRYGEERYKQELEQWRKDNDHAYDAEQARQMGQVSGQLEQLLGTKPDASNRDKELGSILGIVGQATQGGGLGAALPVIQDLIKNYGGAAAKNTQLTDDEKEFERNRQTQGELADFLRQTGSNNLPMPVQVLNEYNRLIQAGDTASAERLLQLAHVTKDVENVRQVAAAGAQGKEQTEAVVEAFSKAPLAFQQYERMKNGFENTRELIQKAKDKLAENPGAAGWTTFLQELPESDAKYIQNILGSIKANVSLDTLTTLKNTSPSGASGFGALSEGELKVISELLGSLEQTQSAGQLLDTLNNIEQRLGGAVAGMQNSLARDKEWFESNKHYAPDLYSRFSGSFGLLQPQAPAAPAAPQAPPAPSTQDSFRNNYGTVTGVPTPQQSLEAEMQRRGLLPGGIR